MKATAKLITAVLFTVTQIESAEAATRIEAPSSPLGKGPARESLSIELNRQKVRTPHSQRLSREQ